MRILLLLALTALSACDGGQPVPTGSENAQLDEAANMLDRAEGNLANVQEQPVEPDGPRQ